MSPSRGGEEDPSVLFRTLCGGHWRFCVVTAFLIVVNICRRGLVPGLATHVGSIQDIHRPDGRRDRPLLTWDRQSPTPLCTAVPQYTFSLLVRARLAGVSALGFLGRRIVHIRGGLRPLRYQGRCSLS